MSALIGNNFKSCRFNEEQLAIRLYLFNIFVMVVSQIWDCKANIRTEWQVSLFSFRVWEMCWTVLWVSWSWLSRPPNNPTCACTDTFHWLRPPLPFQSELINLIPTYRQSFGSCRSSRNIWRLRRHPNFSGRLFQTRLHQVSTVVSRFSFEWINLQLRLLCGKQTHRSKIDFLCVIRGLCYWQQL